MTYQETCNWLFNQTANYESQGQSGYKASLDNMLKLDEHYNHPHRRFKTIHVAGTNGKGSVSHTLSALLQVCGYKVGLYTSPHLIDFKERIRINGRPIDEDYVIRFVENGMMEFEEVGATFFEITTELAFNYFKDSDVDIAIIEVGLGGRLDSTNIITPLFSIITNISLDHTQILGSSVEQIAIEKGGIIKESVPVIIGEADELTRPVFEMLAQEKHAPIVFAQDSKEIISAEFVPQNSEIIYKTEHLGIFKGQLCASCQIQNTRTILEAAHELCKQGYLYFPQNPEQQIAVRKEIGEAFLRVANITGLQGRWQKVKDHPTVICDIGHNAGAWQYLSKQLEAVKCNQMHIVFGILDDKDIYGVMSLLPKNATYYFTRAKTKRAMSEQSLMVFGQQFGLSGTSYSTVKEAFSAALADATPDDFIFVGGSNYVVAEFLETLV